MIVRLCSPTLLGGTNIFNTSDGNLGRPKTFQSKHWLSSFLNKSMVWLNNIVGIFVLTNINLSEILFSYTAHKTRGKYTDLEFRISYAPFFRGSKKASIPTQVVSCECKDMH